MKQPSRPVIRREDLLDDPVEQFALWFEEAREKSGLALPDAACLSTVTGDGYPDGRMVLVKGHDGRGFVFYTNLTSRKAEHLRSTPRASLTLYWEPLRRQVRIQGDVELVEAQEADAYFARRPRGSQIGAWASDQSAPLEDRDALGRRFAEAEERFADSDSVPRPPFWGGFRVWPRAMEFWQEGPDRLHDRFRYERTEQGWKLLRLFP